MQPISPWHDGGVSEVIFNVEEDEGGGFVAVAVGESIFTQSDTVEERLVMVLDAVRCHFDEDRMPARVQLRFAREATIVV